MLYQAQSHTHTHTHTHTHKACFTKLNHTHTPTHTQGMLYQAQSQTHTHTHTHTRLTDPQWGGRETTELFDNFRGFGFIKILFGGST